MGVENFLNFAWKYLIATGNDHVFGAVYDGEVAFFVHYANIASVQPATMQHVCRFVWPIPVSLHHLRSANTNLTGLAWWQHLAGILVLNRRFGIGYRQSNAFAWP